MVTNKDFYKFLAQSTPWSPQATLAFRDVPKELPGPSRGFPESSKKPPREIPEASRRPPTETSQRRLHRQDSRLQPGCHSQDSTAWVPQPGFHS